MTSSHVNLLAACRSHQAQITIVKRLLQGCNNVTKVRIEPRYAIGVDALTLLATLTLHLTILLTNKQFQYKITKILRHLM